MDKRSSALAVAGSLGVLLLAGSPAHADGAFCAIPVLQREHPTEVQVADIQKGLCGAVQIGGHIVRLDASTLRVIDGPVLCSPSECFRRSELYTTPDDSRPYVVILRARKPAHT